MSTTQQTVSVNRPNLDVEKIGFFRFGTIGDGVVLTSESGEWHYLSTSDFHQMLAGSIDDSHAEYNALASKGFLRVGMGLDLLADKLRTKKVFVGGGPYLHRIHLHGADGALDVTNAKNIIDHVMLSTAGSIRYELVADHTSAMDREILQFVKQYGTEKNRYEGKKVSYTLEIDVGRLDGDDVEWLADQTWGARTRLDGPADLHDGNGCASSHASIAENVKRHHEKLTARRRNIDVHGIEIDVHVTRNSLGRAADIVTSLRDLAVRRFRTTPVLDGELSVTIDEYLSFYSDLIDTLLDPPQESERLLELQSSIFLARILRGSDPDDPGTRSPAGYGTGVVSYDPQGNLFPGDDALTLAAQGNRMFELGRAGETSYKEMTAHPTLRALTIASLVECLPGYDRLWSTPYCGVNPVRAFITTGDIFPRQPTSTNSRIQHGVVQRLFEVLTGEDGPAHLEKMSLWID